MTTKIVSLNVNGLRTTSNAIPKRRKLFTWLKNMNVDVIFLQETHSDLQLENVIRNEWGGKCFFAHGDNRSRGVGIFFNHNSNIGVLDITCNTSGRYIVMQVEINNAVIVLANIYGPNHDKPEVFDEFFESIQGYECESMILGGDWNAVLNVKMDRLTRAQRVANNHRCKQTITKYMYHRDLTDIWRIKNPGTRKFTYHRSNPKSKSRIDFFLISESFLSQQTKPSADIKDGYLADHEMISLEVQIGQCIHGKSYWKLNSLLLIDDKYVDRIKQCIQETITANETDEVSKHSVFQTVLCVVRGESIKFSSQKKTEHAKKLAYLDAAINSFCDDQTDTEKDQLDKLKKERDELISNRTEINTFQCKANWRQFGEKGSKYFHKWIRDKKGPTSYKSLELEITAPGKCSDKIDEMLEESASHFEKLYAPLQVQTESSPEAFLTNISPLSQEQIHIGEQPITCVELGATLGAMEDGSSPGPDGFTAEFYKVFWDELKDLVYRVIEEIRRTEIIPSLLKCSTTTLIPKKDKSTKFVRNLRPISLLNVIYKLITKTLGVRLEKMAHAIINEDQTGFLKGRYIGENVRLLIDVMDEASEQNIPGLIMLCDIQQAYDSVSWDYLIRVISKFNFGPNFRKWISMLYTGTQENPITARINMNGCMSRPYIIKRGLRQGCPLSCLLFLLCIEPLGQTIRASKEIIGIHFNGTEIKMSAYADDTALILNGTEDCLRAALEVFDDFEGVSGLRLNKSKTNIMWIGADKNRQDTICKEFDLKWTNQVNYLGVVIGPLMTNMADYNYSIKIDKLKKLLNPWIKRGLTPFGRIHLIKSMALSQLVYLMSVMEKPNKRKLKEIESIMFNFIWNGKRDRIKRSTMLNVYNNGGLQVPDPSTQADSLKVTWIKKFTDESNRAKWKNVMENKLIVGGTLCIFECKLSKREIESKLPNKFWRETFLSWQKIVVNEQNIDESVLYEALWLNKDLILEKNVGIPKKQLIKRGVLRIRDIYDNRARRFMTTCELTQKYNFGNFLMWHAMLRAVPPDWKNALRRVNHRVKGTRPEIYDTLNDTTQIAKWAYPILMKTAVVSRPIKAQTKWEQELQISQVSWPLVFKSLFSSTRDVKLKWLQLRILHRILPTNRSLRLFGIKESSKCERCSDPEETIYHVFWDCMYSKRFWARLQERLCLTQPLTPEEIILGNVNKKGKWAAAPLRMCILLGKQFIWQCRWSKHIQDVERFSRYVSMYVSVERCVVERNGGRKRFDETYSDISAILCGALTS